MIIAATSISGAPGVTTTCLGLALVWPQASLLVETDHQQAVLAGYLGGREPGDRGLSQVAAASQRGGNVGEAIWLAARPLPDDSPTRRRLLLPGPPAPWERAAIDRRWGRLAEALLELSTTSGVDVIIDLGRIQTPQTNTPSALLPPQLLETVDMLVVMLHPTLRSVAASRTILDGLWDATSSAGIPDRLGLVLRTPPVRGRVDHFTPREIAAATHVPVLATVADDPAAAAVLSDGMPRPRRWDSSGLVRSYHRLANRLAARAHPTLLDAWDEEPA